MVFVSRLDEERANYTAALADIKEKFKITPVAITIPMGEGPSFKGIIDVLNKKAYMRPSSHDQKEQIGEVPPEFADAVESARSQLFEAAAEGSDELMEKYLIEGELTQDDTLAGLQKALATGKIVPAFAGSGMANSGTSAFIDFVMHSAPSPLLRAPEKAHDQEGNQLEIAIDPAKSASAFVFKTQIDQFSGRLCYIKVMTGTILPDMDMTIASEQPHKERIGKLYTMQGKNSKILLPFLRATSAFSPKSPRSRQTTPLANSTNSSPIYLCACLRRSTCSPFRRSIKRKMTS